MIFEAGSRWLLPCSCKHACFGSTGSISAGQQPAMPAAAGPVTNFYKACVSHRSTFVWLSNPAVSLAGTCLLDETFKDGSTCSSSAAGTQVM